MSFKILHQLGHNWKWNFDSLIKDNCGDGVIIAPRYISKEHVHGIKRAIKRNSLFDPQFFKPNIPKGKLDTYDFFPDKVAGGFDTEEYKESCAGICAEKCIAFQVENEFSRIVIPTRYFKGTKRDYIDQQHDLFVAPFLYEIREKKVPTPIFLQLIINDLMLKDNELIADVLNWITSIEIDGIYLIAESNSSSKQIKDSEFLLSLIDFIDALKQNDLEIFLGYLNTESLLLSLASPDAITFGTYENMRSFKIRTFEEQDDSTQMGPNPRLYVSRLLQWIEFPYIGALNRAYPDRKRIYDINKYQAEMFEKTFRWHFTKPQLYKHHFLVMTEQLREVSKYEGKKRYMLVRSIIESAIDKHDELKKQGIYFDQNSDGSHLYIWLTVADLYARKRGWA